MSSSDVDFRWGLHLRQPAPLPHAPPPPPPPPPQPPVSTAVSQVLPIKKNGDSSYSEIQLLNLPTTTSYSSRPQPIHIKPTTAGLLRFPALPDRIDQQQIQQARRSLSPQFKQELLEKQSVLLPSCSADNNDGATSIEDKIRESKMNHCRSKTIHYDQRRPFQLEQPVPEKLMSAMQKETSKPFAYTVNVSDPNNRGKLDLSQIKSPTMRRRLLANMESKEEKDDDDDDDGDCDNDDQDRGQTMSPPVEYNFHTMLAMTRQKSQQQQEQQQLGRATNGNRSITFSPVVSFSYADQQQQLSSEDPHRLRQNPQVRSQGSVPIIRYSEPPTFYRSNPPAHQIQTSNLSSSGSPRSERSQQAMDRLDAEMAETLDDFERMLSDMSTVQSPNRRAAAASFQSNPQVQCTNQPADRRQEVAANRGRYDQQSTNHQDNYQNRSSDKDERTCRSHLRTFQS